MKPESPAQPWKPRKGDLVRCINDTDYFSKGCLYRIAKAPQEGCVGMHVYESRGYSVLTRMANFELVEVK